MMETGNSFSHTGQRSSVTDSIKLANLIHARILVVGSEGPDVQEN